VVDTGADDAGAEADVDVVLPLLGGALLLQALATPSVSTAMATVPDLAVRHRLPGGPVSPLTQWAIPVNYWAIPVKC
jgi:hypothetical protein